VFDVEYHWVFQPEEDRPHANQEVVLSYAASKQVFWPGWQKALVTPPAVTE
jgi:hypothetical protein